MAIKSAPYYWVVCDKCGARDEYGDYSALSDPGDAETQSLEGDWTKQGERHHCPECPVIADCENCGKDAGELPLDRDGLCQACWDAAATEETKAAVALTERPA